MSEPIWSPSPERIAAAQITRFIQHVAARWDARVADYDSLYSFSVTRIGDFWEAVWDYLAIVGDKGGPNNLENPDAMPGARWFPQARLNFAENHLRRRDGGPAIIAYAEGGRPRTLSWGELYDSVSRLMQAFRAGGIKPGDRVAACLPNVPEAVIAMLATTGVGAIWSACSIDGGARSLLDRIGQIEPSVLFIADGYRHAGKHFDMREKAEALAANIPSLRHIVLVPFTGITLPSVTACEVVAWDDFLLAAVPGTIHFDRFDFDHPAFILYSSGTTGKPKAIIHGAGGVLLQTVKGLVLHYDLRPDEKIFFPTGTGWMVWNVMVSALVWNSTLVLYDGAPTYPKLDAMFDVIADVGAEVVRLVPPLLEAYLKAGLNPARTHDLSKLKCFASGSAPLLPHHYEYVYSKIKSDLHLMSPAGGTDVMGTLATGNPIGPVYPGEIQVRSLGMSVEILDEAARPVIGRPGELVCTRAFPSIPLGFWGDRDHSRWMDTYFSKYPGVWRHGDWAEITPRGGVIIYGRADATLNVNGVRIGTSEIYRALEGIADIQESVAVAQRHDNVDRIILFVILRKGMRIDEALDSLIRNAIRHNASARHVPAKIVQVADVPRSLNGKPSEIAIREVIHGRKLADHLGLQNPDALKFFEQIAELRM